MKQIKLIAEQTVDTAVLKKRSP